MVINHSSTALVICDISLFYLFFYFRTEAKRKKETEKKKEMID